MYSYTSEQVYENTIRTVNCPSDALSLGQLLLSGVLFTDVCVCVCACLRAGDGGYDYFSARTRRRVGRGCVRT